MKQKIHHPTNVDFGQTTGGPIETSATLLAMNGPMVLIPLTIPPVLTAAGLLVVFRAGRSRQRYVWLTTFLLAVFVFLTGFSIGLFYLLALLLLLTASVIRRRDSQDAR